MAGHFVLDPKLAGDTLPLAESALSLLRIFNDRRYAWLILIPKRAGVSEWFELEPHEQGRLLEEALLGRPAAGAMQMARGLPCEGSVG